MLVDKEKIKEFVKQCNHYNVFPIDLPAYYKSIFNEHPISVFLEELVQQCLQSLEQMNKEEVRGFVIQQIPSNLHMFIEHDNMRSILDLPRIAIYYIIGLLIQYKRSFKDIINYDEKDSEVFSIYPELKNKIDDEGLLTLDAECLLQDGGIYYKEHLLQYHQFLRRGFTSNPNFDFLNKFIKYYVNYRDKNTFKIGIDLSRIMEKKYYHQFFEYDRWYGPKFDLLKIDDPKSIGLTIIKRNKGSVMELTNRMDRTEFYWSYKKGIKTFEIEEIADLDYKCDTYNINKYTHLERNTENKYTQHLDGAVKIYLGDKYAQRFEANIPKEPRSFKKIKLFRIDGEMDMEPCIDLISFFFKSNEMIIEYFNPKQYEELFGYLIRQ